MNKLSADHRIECWKEAVPGNLPLAVDLARIEEAISGLSALNRLLAANHSESQEEDENASEALETFSTSGLHSAASALAGYADRHLGEMRERYTKWASKK